MLPSPVSADNLLHDNQEEGCSNESLHISNSSIVEQTGVTYGFSDSRPIMKVVWYIQKHCIMKLVKSVVKIWIENWEKALGIH